MSPAFVLLLLFSLSFAASVPRDTIGDWTASSAPQVDGRRWTYSETVLKRDSDEAETVLKYDVLRNERLVVLSEHDVDYSFSENCIEIVAQDAAAFVDEHNVAPGSILNGVDGKSFLIRVTEPVQVFNNHILACGVETSLGEALDRSDIEFGKLPVDDPVTRTIKEVYELDEKTEGRTDAIHALREKYPGQVERIAREMNKKRFNSGFSLYGFEEHEVFLAGQQIHLSYEGFGQYAQGTVYLYKFHKLWWDKKLAAFSISGDNGNIDITVSSSWTHDNSEYYFKVECHNKHCNADKWKSPRISLPEHYLTFSSPVQYAIIDPNQANYLDLRWSGSGFKSSDKTDKFTLKKLGLLHDQSLDSKSVSLPLSSGSYRYYLPTLGQSVMPYYVHLKYNCNWFWCREMKAVYFMIPTTVSYSYASSPDVQKDITLFDRNCGNKKCDSTNVFEKALCAACNHGVQVGLKAQMRSIDLDVFAQLTKFQFESNFLKIKRLEARAQASVLGNLDLYAEVDIGFSSSHTYNLLKRLSIYSWGFSIAGIHLDLGFFFSLDFTYDFQFNAKATATVPLSIDAPNIEMLVQHGSDFPDNVAQVNMNGGSVVKKAELVITAEGAASIRASFFPTVSAELSSIASLGVRTELYAGATVMFQYPAFPPASTGVYLPEYKFHAPARCDKSHFMQYHLEAGIGKVTLDARIGIDIKFIIHIHKEWSKSYDLWSGYDFKILAGCLLNANSRSLDIVVDASEGFELALQQDLVTLASSLGHEVSEDTFLLVSEPTQDGLAVHVEVVGDLGTQELVEDLNNVLSTNSVDGHVTPKIKPLDTKFVGVESNGLPTVAIAGLAMFALVVASAAVAVVMKARKVKPVVGETQ